MLATEVKRSYFNLIESVPEVLDFNAIKKSPMQLQEKITLKLKLNGYRFYRTKSKTIINAANYFVNLIKDYKNFRYMDWYDVRTRLIKNVRSSKANRCYISY